MDNANKNLFGKIIGGYYDIHTHILDHLDHIYYIYAESCPDGCYPVVVDNEKPAIGKNEQLMYHMYMKDNVLHKEYIVDDIYTVMPSPKRKNVYSKLNLYVILQSMGLWTTLRNWMESQTLPNGVNVATAYDMAVELADDNELFNTYVSQAAEVLNIPEEQVMAILAQCRKNI